MSKKWGISCRCREIYISLPHITIKSTLMTHAGHRAYKKVDQKNRPCDLRWPSVLRTRARRLWCCCRTPVSATSRPCSTLSRTIPCNVIATIHVLRASSLESSRPLGVNFVVAPYFSNEFCNFFSLNLHYLS